MPYKQILLFNTDAPDDNPMPCTFEEISLCPSCNFGIIPQAITGCYQLVSSEIVFEYNVHILFLCPHCQTVFLAKYTAQEYEQGIYTQSTLALYPKAPQNQILSSSIHCLSPKFVKIFNEAAKAETDSLLEVAGCGYRKAVEHLVKDYLCHKFPEQSEEIKAEFLGKSIQRIEKPEIRTLTERAVWIGNDETHYVRDHEDLDIADMKRFIAATLQYIESELAFEDALSIPHKNFAKPSRTEPNRL